MPSKHGDSNPEGEGTPLDPRTSRLASLQHTLHEEHVLAALALLLGPETDYHVRVRAMRRLARQGPALLPLLLTTLSNYPEITTPSWPWWPPQYEHCSRLLIALSQNAQLRLEALLHHPALTAPAGPVLWTSVIEAAGLLPHGDYESLLCQGLETTWASVRYAAAMALAQLAEKLPLQQTTVETLSLCRREDEPFPVRLAASYALLRSGDSRGLDALIGLLDEHIPHEARKAAIFVLATEPPASISPAQCERLTQLLIEALQDEYEDVAVNAARALRGIASPATLPPLCMLLDAAQAHIQVAALTALEEIAGRKAIRKLMQRNAIPAFIVPLVRSTAPEVRRQASYTLAAIGGDYVAAVLGTIVLNTEHPGHIEAIEALRLLNDVLRTPARTKIVRWLLRALHQKHEEILVTALDSLAYLAWQAQSRGQKKALYEISEAIWHDGATFRLLSCPSSWVRQRAIELLSMLTNPPAEFHFQMRHLLHCDSDSGVRACIIYILGQTATRQALPDLLEALNDSDEHVAETAINALGNLATPDDAIVVYVLKELTWYSHKSDKDVHPLALAARGLLKKWHMG